ncbi:MAG TPA: hypothetical protein VFP61_01550, partial [Acidimicrobiales bacterium]|nr:hypothetical protein [Acidimicrobiales bacterium]
GAVLGGALLAFPAILPAALTLIEQEDGTPAAVHEVGGAVFGGLGLIAFAALAWALLTTVPSAVALAAAAAWTAVAVAFYVLRATGRLPLPRSIAGRRPPATGG